ncbi:arabinose-5-phosphate isomerase [Rhodotorula toruloides]|uniref:Arabinose-5-phosphate isomerase n=1 Tax=Rhodotorula toruloides TaxID=5286 RepID=A0A511K8F8_RHOTO|nr:arabinose-5-phosphate isomerase [Rhodotorula toruloides]
MRERRHSDGIASCASLSQSTISTASSASDESAPPSVIFSSNAPSPSSSLASSPLLEAKRSGFPLSSAAVPPLSLSPPIAENAAPSSPQSFTAPLPSQPTPTELAVYASNVIRNEAYALLALAARLAPAAHPLIDDEGSCLPHYSPASDAASSMSISDEDVDGRSSGSDLGEAALRREETRTNEAFRQVVDLIRSMPAHGKVLVSGIGKSGIVARKMVATFCSLGIQAAFLHPVEALHGDLGIVCSCSPSAPCDTLLLISHSGATAELMRLLPIIRPRVRSLVAVTRDPDSVLAKSCHGWLDAGTGVYPARLPKGTTDEADSTLPAPTSSVVSALAIGDALALTLSRLRIGWDKGGKDRRQEFFHCHPGGQLGIQLGREGRGVDVPASPPSAPVIPIAATPTPAAAPVTHLRTLAA